MDALNRQKHKEGPTIKGIIFKIIFFLAQNIHFVMKIIFKSFQNLRFYFIKKRVLKGFLLKLEKKMHGA